jgi:hypothetical protein
MIIFVKDHESILSHPVSVLYIFMVFTYLCPGLSSGLFPFGFLTKSLHDIINELRIVTYAINSFTSECKVLLEILPVFGVLMSGVFPTAMQLL